VISKLHPYSRWFINIVLAHIDLSSSFHELKSDLLSDSVDLHVQINNKSFNKFVSVKEILNRLTHFDYVLLKVNDIPLAGFNWNTFFDKKSDSIVAGPFRESTEELLFRARFDCTKMKQVIYFQHGAVFNYYNDESFKKTSVLSTMFIEQSFVLLRSDFTSWFFPQILTEKYLNHQSIDWGPDKMWCGAAYAFIICVGMNLHRHVPLSQLMHYTGILHRLTKV